MKLMKFSDLTPGTWVAVGSVVETSDDSVPDVCSVDPRNFGQGQMLIPEKRLKANARLLAAAPRLFLALDDLAFALSIAGMDDEDLVEAHREAVMVLESVGFDLEDL